MQIDTSVTKLAVPSAVRQPVAFSPSSASTIRDVVSLTDTARHNINRLDQGVRALEQAVKDSRSAVRASAMDRVAAAKESLRLLARMSLPSDPGAAREAARLAREIKSAVSEFKTGVNGEDLDLARSAIAGFTGAAGDALKIAKGMVDQHLRKNPGNHTGTNGLKRDVDRALLAVRELLGTALAPSR